MHVIKHYGIFIFFNPYGHNLSLSKYNLFGTESFAGWTASATHDPTKLFCKTLQYHPQILLNAHEKIKTNSTKTGHLSIWNDFSIIRERLERAFDWYKNRQNPRNTDARRVLHQFLLAKICLLV